MRHYLSPVIAEACILASKDKIFTVTFQKSNGSLRVMNARRGVRKNLKGGSNHKKLGVMTAFDVKINSYRSFSLNRIIEIKARGTVLTASV